VHEGDEVDTNVESACDDCYEDVLVLNAYVH
jgi:hypothetical protein